MAWKIFASMEEQARLLVRVRQPETVVVELLVTATRKEEPELRLWARQQGIDVEPGAHQDAGRGVSSLRLSQARVLEGRAASPVAREVVADWLDNLQQRTGIAVVSFSCTRGPVSVWQDVRVKEDNSLLEVVLVPAGYEGRTLEEVAARQGRDVADLRFSSHHSWALRSQYNQFLWVVIPVFLLMVFVRIVQVALPQSRSLVLLLVCLLLVVCGLIYLIKDQGVRAVSAQFAALGAILATTCYEATRYSYDTFYERLDTTPERVGLDYRSILSNQPFFVLSVVLILMILVVSSYALVKTLWRWPSLPKLVKVVLLAVLGFYVYLAAPLLTAKALWSDANQAAETVRAGGSPSTTGLFVWPDPSRVALAAPPISPSGIQQSSYSTVLADADLRLLGGDASSWFLLDTVTGSTVALPRASSPLLIGETGVTRIVTLVREGVRPGRLVVPARIRQKLAVYNETGGRCTIASGTHEVQEHGQTFVITVTVPPLAEVDVQVACRTADEAGPAPLRTLALVAGRE